MSNRIKVGVVAVAAAAVLAAGCSSQHSSTTGTKAKALASSTAAAVTEQNLKAISAKCGTATAAGQIAAAKDLTSHAGRETLLGRCGIPKQNRAGAETAALGAAEHAHLTTRAGRATYFEVTLPKIIEEHQA